MHPTILLSILIFAQVLSIKIHPKLLDEPTLQQDVFLVLKDSGSKNLHRQSHKTSPDRENQIQICIDKLKKAYADSQTSVLSILPSSVQSEQFWIVNRIFLKNVNPLSIAAIPSLGDYVQEIVPNVDIPIPIISVAPADPPKETQWNIKEIGADKVWNCSKKEGLGTIVAIIDTGARYTHEQIRSNYLGTVVNNVSIGWHDSFDDKSTSPNDTVGHGTHCTGIICGNFWIGVAPNITTWIACKACRPPLNLKPLGIIAECPMDKLLTCAQWIMKPNGNFSYVPRVVSNSWGGQGSDTSLNGVIDAWRCAGIYPVFAIGNGGPKCNTTSSPGNQPGVISVGSTNMTRYVSDYSSRGPNTTDSVVKTICPSKWSAKPLFVAPGEKILSSWIFNDTSYAIISGTSMSTPHVAGSVAQLLAGAPSLSYDDVVNIFIDTAIQAVRPADSTYCDCPIFPTPNNIFGNGLINICQAYTSKCACSTITSCS